MLWLSKLSFHFFPVSHLSSPSSVLSFVLSFMSLPYPLNLFQELC
jgi:hypothetical protein